jgi:hypothetical protein
MNFGKLLATGKSFVNTKAETSYRVNKQIYLPKFESPKNPFANLPKPPPEKAAAVKSSIAAAQISRLPSPPPPEPGEHPTSWVSRLKAVSMLRDAPMEKRSEAPVVQAELSLDAVKVVHNDLSDADVEVVPIKSRPAPPDLPPARKSWEILGERLLKATAL